MADIYSLARLLGIGDSPQKLKQVGSVESGQPTSELGAGLASGAADAMKLRPVWQQAFADGQTTLQFPEWLKQQGINNPIMPSM